jgi:hypothetical protein
MIFAPVFRPEKVDPAGSFADQTKRDFFSSNAARMVG